MPANVKANKRRGHQAEGEIGKRTATWPKAFKMVRTGLDGGHDLRGAEAIGEVKAVRRGPAWLSGGLGQLENTPSEGGFPLKFLFVRLSQGPGHPVRWLVTMDVDQFEALMAWME